MARYPGAVWKPLPQNSTQPRIKPVGVVLHTAVSNGTSLWSFFNGRSAGVESHFYVREDGTVEQYMDTEVRADCQLDGNSWLSGNTRYGFVSIETWDGAGTSAWPDWRTNGDGGPAWNAKQLTSLAKLLAWLSKEHDFPLARATGPHGTGVGWHNLFTTSGPGHGLAWNHSHACPGSRRIAQIPALLRAAKEEGAPAQPKEDDLTPQQARQLADVHSALLHIGSLIAPTPDAPLDKREAHGIGFYAACTEKRVFDLANDEETRFGRVIESLQGLYAKVDALAARLDNIQEGEK